MCLGSLQVLSTVTKDGVKDYNLKTFFGLLISPLGIVWKFRKPSHA